MRRALSLLVLVAWASPASATLLLYDGFDYTAGGLLAPRTDTTGSPNPGQHNVAYNVDWRYAGGGATGNDAPGIANGSLGPVSGMPAPLGNSVGFDMTQLGSSRVAIPGAPYNSGAMYWSGFLRVNDVNTLTTAVNGMLLGGFNNTIGPGGLPSTVGAVLRIKQDNTVNVDGNHFFVGTAMNSGSAAGNVQFASGLSLAEGDTVFVVASYEFVAGSNNDVARMWINPNPLDFGAGSPPAATLTSAPGGSVADSFASLSTFNLRNVNTVGNPSVQFDELRIGDSWGSVTPEPATALMLTASGLLLLSSRRRHG